MSADLEIVEDLLGTPRRLGTLAPPPGFVSAFPLFEETVEPLPDSTLMEIAQSGTSDGRKVFDSSYVTDQKSHGCHDDKTEVLTQNGWKKWTEYNWRDLLGTMNPDTGLLEFQEPIEKHVYRYDGPLKYTDRAGLDFALTPNHRMFVRKWDERKRTLSNNYGFCEIGKIGWYAGLPESPTGYNGTEYEELQVGGKKYTGDDFVKLIALIISDGWIGSTESNKRSVSFCYFHEEKRDDIAAMAARCGFNEVPSRKGVWIKSDAALAQWFKEQAFTCDTYRSPYKKVPAVIKTLGSRQLKMFFDYFGDKHDREDGSRHFYSTSKQMADDLQELLLRIGKRSSIYLRPARDTSCKGREIKAENCHDCYTVNEWSSDRLSISRKQQLGEDYYKGDVFCATVPNSTLITRRNDSVLISGNSCNGFACAGVLTRARVRRGLKRVTLSGAYIYSLMNGGRDQGSMLEDALRLSQSNGIASADLVGWDAIYRNRYDTAKADAEAARFKAFEWYAVGTQQGLFTAAALNFEVAVCVHVSRNFMKVNSDGLAGVDVGPGNHAVAADGLTVVNGKLALTGYNSWNTSYGVDGRMLLTWNHFAPTFGNHTFYAGRSTIDDPNDPNNPPVMQ